MELFNSQIPNSLIEKSRGIIKPVPISYQNLACNGFIQSPTELCIDTQTKTNQGHKQYNQINSLDKTNRLMSEILRHRSDLMSSYLPLCCPNTMNLQWSHTGPVFQAYYIYHLLKMEPTRCENRSGGYIIWDRPFLPLFDSSINPSSNRTQSEYLKTSTKVFGPIDLIVVADHGTLGMIPFIHARYVKIYLKRKLNFDQINLIDKHCKFVGVSYSVEKELITLSGACLNHCFAILAAIEFLREKPELNKDFISTFLYHGGDFFACLSGLFDLINMELIQKEMESRRTNRCFHQLSFPIYQALLKYLNEE